MKKILILVLIVTIIVHGNISKAQDSMYVHQKGGIITKIALNNIDSVIFYNASEVPPVSDGTINTFKNIAVGGSISIHGSFLDAETGTVYLSAAVAANQAAIDIIYDQGSVYNSTPSEYFTAGTGTKFATTTMTTTQFDLITNDEAMLPSCGLNSVSVSTGTVVFFITKNNKKGYLKVVSLNTSTDDIIISIKIQK